MTSSTPQPNAHEPVPFDKFLEEVPPGSPRDVEGAVFSEGGVMYVTAPTLRLHCPSEHCNGVRFFDSVTKAYAGKEALDVFLDYRCRHCGETPKTFALYLIRKGTSAKAIKYGELPGFGPPIPAGVIKLVGPDRDLFLRGRRAENQGLGIGAYAYYRRVVENQWTRLIDEIIRVSERINAAPHSVSVLQLARKERQFAKAVEMVKDAIPTNLLIKGHNPITLLHQALSEGIHELSDEDCLDLAHTVRIILEELSEQTAAALKEHAELETALSKLLNRRQGRSAEDQSKGAR